MATLIQIRTETSFFTTNKSQQHTLFCQEFDKSNMLPVKVIFVFAFGMASSVAQEDSNETPYFRKDYTFIKYVKAFYKMHHNSQTWSNALNTCQNEGAVLAVPTSKEEFDEMLKFSGNGSLWIGAHDMFSEGVFVAIDGKQLSKIYINWAPGEPNNANNNENCLMMNLKGYNDLLCTYSKQYICKRSALNITQNILCESYDLGYTYSSDTDRCYKFHETPLTWHKAFSSCISEESTLVIINSDSEARLLTSMLAKYPEKSLKGNFEKGQIHIGFNDLLTPGLYLTNDGKSLSENGYENWSNGQPDNFQNKEHCGSMFRDGTLNDVDCNARQMFVCEKTLSYTQHVPAKMSVNRLPDE
ncbi:secretory phospholipase A2 receptor-like isoform X2 [Arctopsyche grandis]